MRRINLILLIFVVSSTMLFSQHQLPELKYAYDALEPYIDSTTMQIHHTVHHAAYVNNLNKALEKYPQYAKMDLAELLKIINKLPSEIQNSVRNNGGGHYNHSLFWEIMAPAGSTSMSADLEKELIRQFGSVDQFKDEFEKAALGRFGSGWVWLLKKSDDTLYIASTPNQDNMLMPYNQLKGKPILALDVWEHAYYLKFQSKRGAYAQAFWSVVNWNKVSELAGY